MNDQIESLNLREIPGFPDYYASRDGEIWSTKSSELRRLQPDVHKQGYKRVWLTTNEKSSWKLVHRLVALTWIGEPPNDAPLVLHADDDPSNNHVDNLRYGTQSQNMRDAVKNGRISIEKLNSVKSSPRYGESNGNSKLTESEVRKIKQRLNEGKTSLSIANEFNISRATVSQIKTGKTWKNVSCD